MKRRWDDDVVFKNQARGTEEKGKKKEFVNVSSLFPLAHLHGVFSFSALAPFFMYLISDFADPALLGSSPLRFP